MAPPKNSLPPYSGLWGATFGVTMLMADTMNTLFNLGPYCLPYLVAGSVTFGLLLCYGPLSSRNFIEALTLSVMGGLGPVILHWRSNSSLLLYVGLSTAPIAMTTLNMLFRPSRSAALLCWALWFYFLLVAVWGIVVFGIEDLNQWSMVLHGLAGVLLYGLGIKRGEMQKCNQAFQNRWRF